VNRTCTAIQQGLALIMCGALFACASDRAPSAAQSAWLTAPPEGCAIGFSGPTLNPGDAVRRARTHSLENLAAEVLGVKITSELRISETGSSEITEQRVSGIIQQSRIAAMTSVAQAGAGKRLREVYALACPDDLRTADVPHPDFPDWILNLPRDPARLCAIGIGGPTWYPDQQREAALRDAQAALALVIESHIQTRSLDSGRGLAHVHSTSASTERARERAASVASLEADWLDAKGEGPLGLAGVLYGRVCVNTH
jgi:hypothetical protein